MSNTLADEARRLVEVADNLPLGESIIFTVSPRFHGQEEKIILGAENILRSELGSDVVFSARGHGAIEVEA